MSYPLRGGYGRAVSTVRALAAVRVHRQTPLFETVQTVATADIFIPASSYLSAFAGFFHHGGDTLDQDIFPSLIIMPEESTRRHKYFAPHLSYASTTTCHTSESIDDNHIVVVSPIVSSMETEAIFDALQRVVKNRLSSSGNIVS
ncbi:hypothetical protein IV203_038735 [Nitzschia inconspicua]|uniref:Uncharacterized protein n=1 Tax=Nitzschia inconspicua TaxID=303405 RepID=A0A9K3PZQ5_9STRA|nr:hypothetical protein IV203_038735 [Nitzschia inconspicua]